ncbi:MAG: lipid-A-disaccharide synthase [Rickettsiales bacterium]
MGHYPTIAFIAGETSGDQLGGWLIAALKERRADLRYIGLGGPMMAAQGVKSIFPMSDINLIGIAEVLPHVFTIKKRIREMVQFIEQEQPDVVVSIDSPGFVLRVVKQLRARGIAKAKFIHYVAPSVWAYRPERAKLMAERFDFLFCLLPFEPPFFDAVNLPNCYIGHEIAWQWKTRGNGNAFRQAHHIESNAPLLAVFPGSRHGEIDRLLPTFKASIEQLRKAIPALKVVIQVPPSMMPRMLAETVGWNINPLVIDNTVDKKDFFAAATAAIAKSGTIGLECAVAGLPSIIAYRASRISAYLLRRMIKIKYVNLANLLANKLIIPELIQEDCTTQNIVREMLPLLTSEKSRAEQRYEHGSIAAMLGTKDAQSPSEKAAEIVLSALH